MVMHQLTNIEIVIKQNGSAQKRVIMGLIIIIIILIIILITLKILIISIIGAYRPKDQLNLHINQLHVKV